jgi:(E)-4-hydroxy-3-methylbut-2-enyl-diphosphate synthase
MLSVPVDSTNVACLAEVESLRASGCFLIRVAIPTISSLEKFALFRPRVTDPRIAFVADLHFGSELAMDALDLFEKVRINPGNFGIRRTPTPGNYSIDLFDREREIVAEQARLFFEKARRLGRAVRIGCNGGSIAARTLWRWGNGAEASIESALEIAHWAREVLFHSLVFSFKASNALETIALNAEAHEKMEQLGWDYPFHLGVTESGLGFSGRSKSALAIGVLLSRNIGDTVRVSLAEPPENEVKFAKKLVDFCGKQSFSTPLRRKIAVASGGQPPEGSLSIDPVPEPFDGDEMVLEILQKSLEAKDLKTLHIVEGANFPERKSIAEEVVQACGWGRFHTEIIACPTCGRTTYPVSAVAETVRRQLGNFPHLKIAVMGCTVNGIGEMGNADYGCIGCGGGGVNIYRAGNCVLRNVPAELAADALEQLLFEDGHGP